MDKSSKTGKKSNCKFYLKENRFLEKVKKKPSFKNRKWKKKILCVIRELRRKRRGEILFRQ